MNNSDDDDFKVIICSEEQCNEMETTENKICDAEAQRDAPYDTTSRPTELDIEIEKYYDECLNSSDDNVTIQPNKKRKAFQQRDNDDCKLSGLMPPVNSKITKKRKTPLCSGKPIFYCRRRKTYSEELERLLALNDEL